MVAGPCLSAARPLSTFVFVTSGGPDACTATLIAFPSVPSFWASTFSAVPAGLPRSASSQEARTAVPTRTMYATVPPFSKKPRTACGRNSRGEALNSPKTALYCVQFVTFVGTLIGPSSAGPNSAAVLVPTPSIGPVAGCSSI